MVYKIMKNKKTNHIYALVLVTFFAMPVVTLADTKSDLSAKFPSLQTKSCQSKYQSEVSLLAKFVDKSRAKKKVGELKIVRKSQDETIKTIFARIENKPENEDKKEIVENYKDDVTKILDEHRSKIDDLQASIQISDKDIDDVTKSSVLEQATTTPKVCPINSDTIKDIRVSSKAKLKKLIDDKREEYINQTKEIQQEFLTDIKVSLANLSDDLKK